MEVVLVRRLQSDGRRPWVSCGVDRLIHHSLRFTVCNLKQKQRNTNPSSKIGISQPMQSQFYQVGQVGSFYLLKLGTQVWCSLQLKHLDFLPAYIRTVSRHNTLNKSDGSIAWQISDPRFYMFINSGIHFTCVNCMGWWLPLIWLRRIQYQNVE